MAYIDEQLKKFKNMIEDAIVMGGAKGKESCIRSLELKIRKNSRNCCF